MTSFKAFSAAAIVPPPRRKAVRLALALAVLAAATPVAPASAAVVSASSSAFGESVTLVTTPPVLPPVTVTSGPLPTNASGTAPAPYDVSRTVLGVSVTGNILNTGTLTSTAASTVDGLSGARTANASSTVQNLAISIL